MTRLVPFEMVDEVLAATGRTQSRIRLLPARVVMYLLLAACLFTEVRYRQAWSKLTSGLHGMPVASPSGSALRQARQRLGPQPMRAMFDLLRGPAATAAAQVRWRGLLLTRGRRHHPGRGGLAGQHQQIHQTPLHQRKFRLPPDAVECPLPDRPAHLARPGPRIRRGLGLRAPALSRVVGAILADLVPWSTAAEGHPSSYRSTAPAESGDGLPGFRWRQH
ncbi:MULTISPECIES: transposase domain-containing protein [unclassified Micromonospora]|uniref:transposase domain-containing protein n=1 Tax=unclassified Micromonospora TaxID=2617518 RepID=UPI002FEED1C1